MSLYFAFASTLAVGTAHLLHARSASTVQLIGYAGTQPKYLVLLVLDGARPDYFGLTPLPHVDALRANGAQFTHAMAGILEAETPAGHATIATGSRPDSNGILGFDWGDDNDKRVSLFAPDKMESLEQIMEDNGSSTLAGLYKRKYPGARVVAISGHKYYAAAPLGGPKADAIMYYQGSSDGRYVPVAVPGHVPPTGVLDAPGVIGPSTHLPTGGEDHLATMLALAAVQHMHPRMLLINYPEFDWPLGHVDGGILDRTQVATAMQDFDSDLGTIEDTYRRAGILDQTLFVITADHGMMPITHFVPSSVVTTAIAQAGTTASDIASNSGDYIWLSDPSRSQSVAQSVMAAQEPGIQSAYYLTTVNGKPGYVSASAPGLPAKVEATNQYLLGALLDGHQPSLVVFGEEGTSFSDPGSNWKADHGGNSWQSQHIPLLLSGPGIRAGVISSTPAQLDDLAPTILAAMGVRAIGMEGHALNSVLLGPPTNRIGRAGELAEIGPIVKALRAQG
jgi:hypothetical protein